MCLNTLQLIKVDSMKLGNHEYICNSTIKSAKKDKEVN